MMLKWTAAVGVLIGAISGCVAANLEWQQASQASDNRSAHRLLPPIYVQETCEYAENAATWVSQEALSGLMRDGRLQLPPARFGSMTPQQVSLIDSALTMGHESSGIVARALRSIVIVDRLSTQVECTRAGMTCNPPAEIRHFVWRVEGPLPPGLEALSWSSLYEEWKVTLIADIDRIALCLTN